MKTFHEDRITPERQTTNREYHNNELDGFGHQKYERSEKLKYNKIPNAVKPSGYFQGQANLNTDKVVGYYYITQTNITFED